MSNYCADSLANGLPVICYYLPVFKKIEWMDVLALIWNASYELVAKHKKVICTLTCSGILRVDLIMGIGKASINISINASCTSWSTTFTVGKL